jgi:hypothetical protein
LWGANIHRRACKSAVPALCRKIEFVHPTRDGQTVVDRDQLLRTLFPNGVPPQEDVIRRLTSWLDEVERLAKL